MILQFYKIFGILNATETMPSAFFDFSRQKTGGHMTQIFMPDNNPETPFNTEKVSRKGRKGKVDVRTLYMADTIQAISQKNARMWQIIALVSLVSFFISLGICFYAVTLPKTVPVIVTVDSDGYTNYVGKVDRSAYGKTAVPEQAKTYVIKKLITNMHTRVIDPEAQRRFIDECLHVCQGSACRAVQVFLMTGPKLHLPLLPDRILYIFSLAAHIKSQPISSPLVGL